MLGWFWFTSQDPGKRMHLLLLALVSALAIPVAHAQTKSSPAPKAWASAALPKAKDIDGLTLDMSQREALATVSRKYPGIEFIRYDVVAVDSVSFVGQHVSAANTTTTFALEADSTGRLWRVYRHVRFPAGSEPKSEDLTAMAVEKYGAPAALPGSASMFTGSVTVAADSEGRAVPSDGDACPDTTLRAFVGRQIHHTNKAPGDPGFQRDLLVSALRNEVAAERDYLPPPAWFNKLLHRAAETPVPPAKRCRWQLTVAPLLSNMLASEMLDYLVFHDAKDRGAQAQARRAKALTRQTGL